MRNYKPLLIILLWPFLSCEDEGSRTFRQLSSKPPFDTFWFSSRFDLPSTTPSEIQGLSFYSVFTETNGSVDPDEFRYTSPNVSEEITAITTGNIITLSTSGKLNLSGTKPPKSFTGDATTWSSQCEFQIVCKINTDKKEVTSATLHLFSTTFDSSYDLTSIMFFADGSVLTPGGSGPEWNIGNDVEFINDISKDHSIFVKYTFTIDDVLGTSYKN